MSAVQVATQPRALRFGAQGPIAGMALVIGMAAGVVLGAVAMRPASVPAAPAQVPAVHGPDAADAAKAANAATASGLVAYHSLVANIQVAESQHDRRALIRFGSQMHALLTAETIGSIYLEREQLQSDLAAAEAQGDIRSIARIGSQLDKLCGTKASQAYLEFCN
jgi:cation transporter-like permease